MRLIPLILIACGGPSAAPVAPVANTPPARPETLANSLAHEIGVGKSVAIVGGADGIVAISSDGARRRALVPEATSWVIVDARSNVVWYGGADGTAIRALDLEQPDGPSPSTRTVVTGLPAPGRVEMVGPVYFGISYPDVQPGESLGEAMFGAEHYALGESLANANVSLVVMTEPFVSGSSGYQRDEQWEADLKTAVISDRAFVLSLLARKSHRIAAPKEPPETKVAGVDPSNCENADECGKAQPIPGTHYWRVLTAHMTGDVGHFSYRLYDAEAKRFVDGEWATWLSNMSVAPDASAFVVDGVVVRFDGGPITATKPRRAARGGGWIGGGTFYGL